MNKIKLETKIRLQSNFYHMKKYRQITNIRCILVYCHCDNCSINHINNMNNIKLETKIRLQYNFYQMKNYRQITNISRTKFQILNVTRLVLQLSLRNPLKPCVKSRMKLYLEQRREAALQLHLSNQQFCCLVRCGLY